MIRTLVSIVLTVLVTLSSAAQDRAVSGLVISPAERQALAAAFGPDLAESELVIVGEAPHYTDEVSDLVATVLIPDLQELGCRLYMAESCHAYSWIVDLYVTGEIGFSELPLSATFLNTRVLADIREMNAALPEEDRVHVAMIDINHFPWAFQESVERLGAYIELDGLFDDAISAQFGDHDQRDWRRLPEGGRITAQAIGSLQTELISTERLGGDEYVTELERSLTQIESDENHYRALWGGEWHDLVHDLVVMEIRSYRCRRDRNGVLREESMHQNITRELASHGQPALLVVGSGHARRDEDAKLGGQLSGQYRTIHLLAYGISGTRLGSFSREGVEFSEINLHSPDNLSTVFANVCNEPSLVILEPDFASQWRWLNRTRLVPSQAWDGFIVFPKVTVLSELR